VIALLKRSKQGVLLLFPILLVLALIFLIINGYSELQLMRRLAQKRGALILVNQELNRANEEMYRKITRLKQDPIYLEEIARKEFGLVKPDEIIFFLDEGQKKEASLNDIGTQFTQRRQ
jgi:cell division protein FtsB